MTLYRHIPVYRRIEGGVVLYHLFEVAGRGYVVQSKDTLHADAPLKHERFLQKQMIELLSECAPEERSELASSIEAAIDAFDTAFAVDASDESQALR